MIDENFGLSPGMRVRTTEQHLQSSSDKKHKYGIVVTINHYGAWVQCPDGERILLGCAWWEPWDGPLDGELTETTIDDILESR